MKNREKGYSNYYKFYGFTNDCAKKLKEYCRSKDFSFHNLLHTITSGINPDISLELYQSIVDGIGYDNLSKKKYIPLPPVDFYAYQRKCLFVLHTHLLIDNKSEYITMLDE